MCRLTQSISVMILMLLRTLRIHRDILPTSVSDEWPTYNLSSLSNPHEGNNLRKLMSLSSTPIATLRPCSVSLKDLRDRVPRWKTLPFMNRHGGSRGDLNILAKAQEIIDVADKVQSRGFLQTHSSRDVAARGPSSQNLQHQPRDTSIHAAHSHTHATQHTSHTYTTHATERQQTTHSMSFFGMGGRPQISSEQKIAQAEAEIDMVSDMYSRYLPPFLSSPPK
jgi:hypothetical protein